MAGVFWFKFYVNDWSGDTKPLSLEARGLLMELIIHLRKNDGEMEFDLPLIVRLSGGLTERITEIFSEFRRFKIFDFEIRDGKEFLISRKIKKEFRKSLTNKANGLKGGNPILTSDNRLGENSDNRPDNPISDFDSISDFNNKKGVEAEFPKMDSKAAAIAKTLILARKTPEQLFQLFTQSYATLGQEVTESRHGSLFYRLGELAVLATADIQARAEAGTIPQPPKKYLTPYNGEYGWHRDIHRSNAGKKESASTESPKTIEKSW